MEPESRARPTLAAVAQRAGVSPSTASLAFSGTGPVSDTTRDKVLQAARDLGYAGPDPRARSLRRGRSGIIAAVIPDSIRISFLDPVLIQTLDGLADELTTIGASLLLIPDTGDGEESVAQAPVDAVVLMGCSDSSPSMIEALGRRGIPVVSIEGVEAPGFVAVNVDNRDGERMAAEYVRSLGHTRVAQVALQTTRGGERGFVGANEWRSLVTVQSTRERWIGADEIYPGIRTWATRGSRIEEGHRGGMALLDVPADERPTAILAQSDLLAAGVIGAAEELGLSVPGDLSVIGFDGIRVEGLGHDLSTVVQPSRPKGVAAGRILRSMLAGEAADEANFPVRLHPGGTVAAPHGEHRSEKS
ncbi:LacI family DNA-binding transcriptional regulator [Okibacterium fritillariae]|uniref:Transcriptional regulator, LacI family n=1 Tax=Okibacterium fritillariae TaxID=123320 RepID=A0A1T5IGI3_9MICO|nr:LacI family DNA-binding transcriptional regulator [Okibacterium fritillariae]SKC38123.1 transcriptional regulator, LacI family [Okibacterium fritillariae]